MITFTQFMRPDGRKETVTIDRPADIEAKAEKLIAKGCRFECESLTTGHVSLTVEMKGHEKECGPVAMQVVENGPAVPVAVDNMISYALEQIESGRYPFKEQDK